VVADPVAECASSTVKVSVGSSTTASIKVIVPRSVFSAVSEPVKLIDPVPLPVAPVAVSVPLPVDVPVKLIVSLGYVESVADTELTAVTAPVTADRLAGAVTTGCPAGAATVTGVEECAVSECWSDTVKASVEVSTAESVNESVPSSVLSAFNVPVNEIEAVPDPAAPVAVIFPLPVAVALNVIVSAGLAVSDAETGEIAVAVLVTALTADGDVMVSDPTVQLAVGLVVVGADHACDGIVFEYQLPAVFNCHTTPLT